MLSEIITGKKGVFYGRYSTKKQTIEAQRSTAYEFVQRYNGEIIEDYKDDATSARTVSLENRKDISRLMSDAYLRKFDYVIVSNHDRLARNPIEHQIIRYTLSALGIPVVISTSGSLYDSGDYIVDLVKDGTSKLEVENTRVRTTTTMRKIAKEGKWTGGVAPYGVFYDKEKKKFERIEEKIQPVIKIFDLYSKHLGARAIAKILSKDYIYNTETTTDGTIIDKKWSKEAVLRIITNPFYAGYFSLGRNDGDFADRSKWLMIPIPSLYEFTSIITLEKWEYCYDLCVKRQQMKTPPKQVNTSYLFKGILKCLDCNQMLTTKDYTSKATDKNGKPYGERLYICNTCRYRVAAEELHPLAKILMNEIAADDPLIIINSIQEKFQHDKSILEKDVAALDDSIQQIQSDLRPLNKEIELLIDKIKKYNKEDETNGIIDENKILAQALILRRNVLEQRIRISMAIISKKEIQINYIEKYELHPEIISQTISDLHVPADNLSLVNQRRFLLYLIKDMTIDHIGNIDIQTRHSSISKFVKLKEYKKPKRS